MRNIIMVGYGILCVMMVFASTIAMIYAEYYYSIIYLLYAVIFLQIVLYVNSNKGRC